MKFMVQTLKCRHKKKKINADTGNQGHGERRAAYLPEVVMEAQDRLQRAWLPEGAGVDPKPQASSACLVSFLG